MQGQGWYGRRERWRGERAYVAERFEAVRRAATAEARRVAVAEAGKAAAASDAVLVVSGGGARLRWPCGAALPLPTEKQT